MLLLISLKVLVEPSLALYQRQSLLQSREQCLHHYQHPIHSERTFIRSQCLILHGKIEYDKNYRLSKIQFQSHLSSVQKLEKVGFNRTFKIRINIRMGLFEIQNQGNKYFLEAMLSSTQGIYYINTFVFTKIAKFTSITEQSSM